MKTLSDIDLLGRLVAFDTVSAKSNLDLIAFVREYLDAWGVPSETIPDETGLKANLLATIGPKDRPGYVLSGHTDVVPVEGQSWSRDPFTLVQDGDRLFGRGTTDMKGFLACVLAQVPAMLAAPLKAPFHIAFSYDEEVGCLGVHGLVRHLGATVPPPVAALIGEPTAMGVVDGHKGSTGMLTTVLGKSCHSSRPDLGVNAIFYAGELLAELHRIAADLKTDIDPASPFEVPYTSVSVGVIQGGTARNAIAGDCAIQWDIRAVKPGVVEAVVQRFDAFCRDAVLPRLQAGFADGAITTRMVYDVPPLVPAPGSVAETLAKRLAGKNQTATVNYGSEAGIFQAAGIPSVLCGPGRDTEAHITDEWISVGQMHACSAFLGKLIAETRT